MTHGPQSKPNGTRDATTVSQIPGENEMVCHGQPLNEDLRSDLEVLTRICDKHHVKIQIVIHPGDHMEHGEVAKRAAVVRDLHELKWKPLRIASLCPVSESTLRRFKRRQAA